MGFREAIFLVVSTLGFASALLLNGAISAVMQYLTTHQVGYVKQALTEFSAFLALLLVAPSLCTYLAIREDLDKLCKAIHTLSRTVRREFAYVGQVLDTVSKQLQSLAEMHTARACQAVENV